MGPGVARNLGVKKANSSLLMFLDIDDRIETKYLNGLIKYCKKIEDNFIFLNMKSKRIRSPYVPYNKNNLKIFFRSSTDMFVIGKIFKKEFLIKNNLFFLKNIY